MKKFASAAVVGVAVAHHVPAAACTIFIPTVQEMQFSVADGDVVPRNLVLYSNFYGAADGSSWWLTSVGRAPQQLVMTFPASERGAVTLTTAEPLLPATSYTLRWSATDAPPDDTADTEDLDGDGVADDVSITFTTSTDDDTSAPAAPTASHATETVLPYQGCDGDWQPGATWSRFFITPDDDDVIAAYVLRDVDTGLGAAADNDRDHRAGLVGPSRGLCRARRGGHAVSDGHRRDRRDFCERDRRRRRHQDVRAGRHRSRRQRERAHGDRRRPRLSGQLLVGRRHWRVGAFSGAAPAAPSTSTTSALCGEGAALTLNCLEGGLRRR